MSDVDAVTPESLRAYLDRRLGADARHNARTYEDATEVLRRLALHTIAQVEACIADLDGDRIDRVVTGGRSGQIYRFELLLKAALGEAYVRRHPWSNYPRWVKRQRSVLRRLKRAGINVGSVRTPPMAADVGAPVDQVAASMDAPVELVPLLPDLLEEVWQLGGPAEEIVPMLRSAGLAPGARVLDLGCGKGAAALALVEEIGAEVDGVDAMPAFIREAKRVAAVREIAGRYNFRCGDLHEAIAEAEKAPYDVIMLLAMGRILGGVAETCKRVPR